MEKRIEMEISIENGLKAMENKVTEILRTLFADVKTGEEANRALDEFSCILDSGFFDCFDIELADYRKEFFVNVTSKIFPKWAFSFSRQYTQEEIARYDERD